MSHTISVLKDKHLLVINAISKVNFSFDEISKKEKQDHCHLIPPTPPPPPPPAKKKKYVCDIVDYMCLRLQKCREVLVERPLSYYSMTRESSPVPRFNFRPSDRSLPPHGSGSAVPRMGTCCARGTLSHGTRYSMGNKIMSRRQH